jgi:hypothetical protein
MLILSLEKALFHKTGERAPLDGSEPIMATNF